MAKNLNIIVLLVSQANDSGMREAEAKGLSRDSNYYFYVQALQDKQPIELGGVKYYATQGDYVVMNRGIRHGIGNKAFITRFVNNRYVEVSLEKSKKHEYEYPF